MFESVRRQEFREYFQPSRISIAIIKSDKENEYNLITLCFSMYCSYKPNMISFSVQNTNYSYKLLDKVDHCVLAIPGEKLAEETLFCGDMSGKNVDKIRKCGFTLYKSSKIETPSILEMKSNIELKIVNKIITGDHLTVFGEVLSFNVNKKNVERNLVSVGKIHEGYEILAAKGIHRIATIR